MTDESGEAKPVDGVPASAPAAPAPVPAPVRIDVIPTAEAPSAADLAIPQEGPPASVEAVLVEAVPTTEVVVETTETPDVRVAEAGVAATEAPDLTVAEARPETADEPYAIVVAEVVGDTFAFTEATPSAVEAVPPADVPPDELAPVAAPPASEPTVATPVAEAVPSLPEPAGEPAPVETIAEPAPVAAEPPIELPVPAELQPEPAPISPIPPPRPVVRERRSILPMLEFTAWRLLELAATVVAASVLIGLLLPGEGTADAVVLIERLAVTVPLVMLALLVAVIIGLPTGYAAARVGSWLDVVLRAATTLGVSLNPIWLAMLLVLLFALSLQWVQPGGFVPWQQSPLAALTSLFLPALALGLPLGAEVASRLRDSFTAVLNGPTMRTAEVMGLSRGEAIRDHAWQRALAGLFVQLGVPLALLVPMSLVVEAVFYLPGLSRQIFTALADRDFAALQLGLVTLVALVALCRFLGRMLEAWFDPRLARHA